MSFFSTATISSVVRAIVDAIGVINVLETPTNGAINQQGNASGHAYVEVSGGAISLPTDASTETMQNTQNDNLALMAGTTNHVAVTATTFSPPLRWLYNSGSLGTVSIKGTGDSTAVDIVLDTGGQLTSPIIGEVTAIGAGMTLVGGW